MRIGLDFGTTNSGAAVFNGHRVRVLPLDLASSDPGVVRSLLYITRDHQVTIGQEAMDTYYRQNTGRPRKMVRQNVGQIEMTFGDVGSVKGYPIAPVTTVRDVHVMIDELLRGRLLRSLKSALATGYDGTTIFGRYYRLEDLIALYLCQLRERVEGELGGPVDGVVMGRPVRFAGSEGNAGDQRAERRLRDAAGLAGFRDVAFELEPVAAALHYELTVGEPQNVVVLDFGGGTLDVTVMRIGEPGRRQIYATGGLGIAGDAFDRRIMAGLMLDHFGRGTTWGEDDAPFPRVYSDALLDWQTIPELTQPETLNFLQFAQSTGSHPARVRALESLLLNNQAMRLVDQVEQAKVALSSAHFTLMRLTGEDINVWQPLTRSQFEALITDATRRVEACLLGTLARSGLDAEEIDTVVRTGGSAQIPCFVALLARVFGPQRVVLSDVFSGVTAGLAVRAHG